MVNSKGAKITLWTCVVNSEVLRELCSSSKIVTQTVKSSPPTGSLLCYSDVKNLIHSISLLEEKINVPHFKCVLEE